MNANRPSHAHGSGKNSLRTAQTRVKPACVLIPAQRSELFKMPPGSKGMAMIKWRARFDYTEGGMTPVGIGSSVTVKDHTSFETVAFVVGKTPEEQVERAHLIAAALEMQRAIREFIKLRKGDLGPDLAPLEKALAKSEGKKRK